MEWTTTESLNRGCNKHKRSRSILCDIDVQQLSLQIISVKLLLRNYVHQNLECCLQSSVYNQSLAVLLCLLQIGIPVDVTGNHGWTALLGVTAVASNVLTFCFDTERIQAVSLTLAGDSFTMPYSPSPHESS